MRPDEAGRPRRILGYARVSSREQALGTSLQDQQNALKAYAEARGLTVARYFVEAESAVHEKFERREKMQQLMAELRPGDLVLCDKLDRWSRDPEFTYRSMRQAREVGARVYFVGEQLDPTTPEGDSLLGLRVMMAREEHKRIRLRMVGTRKLLRNQGLYVEGLPPPGYRRQLGKGQRQHGIEKNALLVEKTDADLVVEFFELSAKGWSIGDLLVHARKKNKTRKWDKKGINNILHNRVYLGEAKDARGVWIRGRQDAIVGPELFARTQAALAKRKLGGARAREDSHTNSWLLRGLATCARCGAHMGAAYGGGISGQPGVGYVYYYRCVQSCGVRYAPVKSVDAEVSKRAMARLVALRRELSAAPVKKGATTSPEPDYAQQRAKIEQRRDRLLESRLDGHLTRDDFNARMAKLDAERTRIDAAEATASKRSAVADPAERRALLSAVSAIRGGWGRMNPEERRAAIQQLAVSVGVERDKPAVIKWRTIEEMAEEVRPGP